MPSVPLVTGDPRGAEPASFVRFALPFAYRAAAWTAGQPGPRFTPPQDGEDRAGYLTAETDRVLFERAGWFESGADWAKARFTVPRLAGGGRYTVEIQRPRLVLFEWESRHSASAADPLATGFLLLEAWFPEGGGGGPDLDDLLRFQELFRFWREPFTGHDAERGFSETLGEGLGSHLPLEPVSAGDRYGARWLPLLDLPVQDGAGRTWRLWPRPAEIPDRARFPYADPRAFVWTCALVEGGADALPSRFGADRPARHVGHWIKLLNVDPPGPTPTATAESTEFEQGWSDARTYRRWEHDGSLYGFGYHGGAMLASPRRAPPIWKHWAGHYFDQTLLLLYLRVTSFRFSGRLTDTTAKARGGRGERSAWRREFGQLREDFALFTNLYEFPLVSNQQQAIEMYSLAREHLDVAELFREVEKEIGSTHEYFENEAGQLQAQWTMVLTLLAALTLPMALVTGFFGMNVVGEDVASCVGEWRALVVGCVVAYVLIIGLAAGLWRGRNRLMDRWTLWPRGGARRRARR